MAEQVISVPDFGENYAIEKITVDNTVGGKALSASVYESRIPAMDDSIGSGATGPGNVSGNTIKKEQPRVAVIQNTSQDIRYLFTGVGTVSSTNGMPLLAGQTLVIKGFGKIKDLRMIRSTGSSSTVLVSYYR
jgi:hypothetical protein